MTVEVVINGSHFQITRSNTGALDYRCKLCSAAKLNITSEELLKAIRWNDEHQLEHRKPAR
ncbi:MAG: hypothetical protein ACYCU8_00640 [Ferrimicrobium acidiphilum]